MLLECYLIVKYPQNKNEFDKSTKTSINCLKFDLHYR